MLLHGAREPVAFPHGYPLRISSKHFLLSITVHIGTLDGSITLWLVPAVSVSALDGRWKETPLLCARVPLRSDNPTVAVSDDLSTLISVKIDPSDGAIVLRLIPAICITPEAINLF